jgi:hypothetical protein
MRTLASVLVLACALFFAHTSVHAQPNTVSFQGQVGSGGVPYDGPAVLKFALLCGTSTVWSNDGSSTNGSQPLLPVGIEVVNGIFSVLLGDAALGMLPLDASVLTDCGTPRLRTWVDLGSGFEQMQDQPLSSAPFALQATNAERAPSGFTVTGLLSIRNAQDQATISADASTGQLALNSIRFPDGTVQSTAANTGSTNDGDWIISGTDLYASVSGNVGVGTASPSQKLHLQTGTGVPVRLALRSGGSWHLLFEQDPESVFSITNGGQKRLAIQPNGNVGIGTTTPGRRLDVVGETRLQGNVEVTGALTVGGRALGSGTHLIPGAAFSPERNTVNVVRDYQSFRGLDANVSVFGYAPVMLPHGATITGIDFVVTDTNAERNITIGLQRAPLLGGNPVSIVIDDSGTSAGRQVLANTLSHVVDNENYIYTVFASWFPASSPSSMAVNAVRIRYVME